MSGVKQNGASTPAQWKHGNHYVGESKGWGPWSPARRHQDKCGTLCLRDAATTRNVVQGSFCYHKNGENEQQIDDEVEATPGRSQSSPRERSRTLDKRT